MTKKLRQYLIFALCLVLVSALSIGGTLAWLQAKTNQVKNTFSPSDIGLTLDEADTDDTDGDKNTTERDLVNNYKMLLVEARENDLKLHNINNQDFFNLMEIPVFSRFNNSLNGRTYRSSTLEYSLAISFIFIISTSGKKKLQLASVFTSFSSKFIYKKALLEV